MQLIQILVHGASRGWRLRHLFPLTPLGLAVAGTGVWASHSIGVQEVDHVVRAGGLLALGILALCILLVILGTAQLWLRVRRLELEADVRLETGLHGSSGLVFGGLAYWPLINLRVIWEEPRQVEAGLRRRGARLEELIRAGRRGESHRVARRFIVEDQLGFARLGAVMLRSRQHVWFRPRCSAVTAHVVAHIRGGDALSHPAGPPDGELLELRRYAHGDPLRHVVWKAFARTRTLLVRAPERAITPHPSGAGYFVSGEGDEPAAGAARYFVEQGLMGEGFSFLADGALAPTSSAEEAVAQIIRSAACAPREGAGGLRGFIGGLDEQRRRSLILFVPAHSGPWVERVSGIAHLIPGARVITAVDAPPLAAPRALRRILFADDHHAQQGFRRLGLLIGQLAGKGLEVQVLHRPSGEFFGQAQLEALTPRVQP